MYVLSKIEHLFIIFQTAKMFSDDKIDVFLSITSAICFSKNRVIKMPGITNLVIFKSVNDFYEKFQKTWFFHCHDILPSKLPVTLINAFIF